MGLLLDSLERRRLWEQVVDEVESYLDDLPGLPVAPVLDPESLRRRLAAFDFTVPVPPEELVSFTADQLRRHQVHVDHPGYYGLFNPAPTTMSIATDDKLRMDITAMRRQVAHDRAAGRLPFMVVATLESARRELPRCGA